MFNTFVPFAAAHVFTTVEVAGREVEEAFGLVGVQATGMNAGGKGLEKFYVETGEALLKKAIELGGNAVVGARLESLMGNILLYGTAVRLSAEKPR